MYDFLDQLGLGGLFESYSLDYQQRMQQQYNPQYLPICIHTNCPMCLENSKRYQELLIKQEEKEVKEKEEYKKRCMEYMNKFRDKKERKI